MVNENKDKIIYIENNIGYIQSKYIHVFPCAWRGHNGVDSRIVFDPESKYTTEHNLTKKSGHINDLTDTYIKSWGSANHLICNIKGYYFDIAITPDELINSFENPNTSFTQGMNLFAKIRLEKRAIYQPEPQKEKQAEQQNKVETTYALANQFIQTSTTSSQAAGSADLDNKMPKSEAFYFTGLSFILANTVQPPEEIIDNTNFFEYNLKLATYTDKWEINKKAYLDYILKLHTDNGSISFNNCAANGDFSFVNGKNTSAEGSYSHAEGAGILINTFEQLGGIQDVQSNWTNISFSELPAEKNLNKLKITITYDTVPQSSVITLLKLIKINTILYLGYNLNGQISQYLKTSIIDFVNRPETSAPYTVQIICSYQGEKISVDKFNKYLQYHTLQAIGEASHVEGDSTLAIGKSSHTEGSNTTAIGESSHAEGTSTIASGNYSHAEGISTGAFDRGSHAEGISTLAVGACSHAEGHGGLIKIDGQAGIPPIVEENTTEQPGAYLVKFTCAKTSTNILIPDLSVILRGASAAGDKITVQAKIGAIKVIPDNPNTHKVICVCDDPLIMTATEVANFIIVDRSLIAKEAASHAEGKSTMAVGKGAHTEGRQTVAFGENSHAEGYSTKTAPNGLYSHAEGKFTIAIGEQAHAEGDSTVAVGTSSHTEGSQTEASGNYAHAEGYSTNASGQASHAEGTSTIAYGENSHAEGSQTKAYGGNSHAEGQSTIATGNVSHAEGWTTNAEGNYAHAEGEETTAFGNGSHAEGERTVAYGTASHAEGTGTKTLGENSHAEGESTLSTGIGAHAEGKGNIINPMVVSETIISSPTKIEMKSTEVLPLDGRVYFKYRDSNSSPVKTILTKIISVNYSTKIYECQVVGEEELNINGILVSALFGNLSAIGDYSHAEGYKTWALHKGSHTEGLGTRSSANYQHVTGKYNADNQDALVIVGNGRPGDTSTEAVRSNILEVEKDKVNINGNVAVNGDVAVNGVNLVLFMNFYIDGHKYLTTTTMTFKEWINSIFNTDKYIIKDHYICSSTDETIFLGEDIKDDTVIESKNYTWKPIPIYGIEWDLSKSPAVTRTEQSINLNVDITKGGLINSDFDKVMPYKNITEVKDSKNNKFVRIPKFYIKYRHNSASRGNLSISPIKINHNYRLSPCFIKYNYDTEAITVEKELDYIDIGKYLIGEGSIKSSAGASSVSHVIPAYNFTRNQGRAACVTAGKDYRLFDIWSYELIFVLFAVEFNTFNSQSVMRGYTSKANNHILVKNGECDFLGPNKSGSAKSSILGTSPMCYRGIENLYGNLYQWIDGISHDQPYNWLRAATDATVPKSNINIVTSQHGLGHETGFVNYFNDHLLSSSNSSTDVIFIPALYGDSTIPNINFGDKYTATYPTDSPSNADLSICYGGYHSAGDHTGMFNWISGDDSSHSIFNCGGRLIRKQAID